MAIKDLPGQERPRERLVRLGAEVLSTAELLAIIIRVGTASMSALELGGVLIEKFGGLGGIAQASVSDLAVTSGIGMAKAAQIKAALELGKRLCNQISEPRALVNGPRDIANLLMEDMRYLDREHFKAVLLNTKNRVLDIVPISVGSLNTSLVHPREVFKDAIKRSCAAIVLVHNHPSGDPAPSREDVAITRKLAEVGRFLGIEVADHVILGDKRFVSLREAGLLSYEEGAGLVPLAVFRDDDGERDGITLH